MRDNLKLPGKYADFCDKIGKSCESLYKLIQLTPDLGSVKGRLQLVHWLRSTAEVWEPTMVILEAANPELGGHVR